MKSRTAARTKSDRPANPRSLVRLSICCTSESGSETDMIDIRLAWTMYQLILRLSPSLFDGITRTAVVRNPLLRVIIHTAWKIDSFTGELNNRDGFRRSVGLAATRQVDDHRDHCRLRQPRRGRGCLLRPDARRPDRPPGVARFYPDPDFTARRGGSSTR